MYYISFPFNQEDLEIFCDQPLGKITEEQMQEIIICAEDCLEDHLGDAMRLAVKQVLGVETCPS